MSITDELREISKRRAERHRARLMQDYREAYSNLSEAEREGDDLIRRLHEQVNKIEANRAKTLADALKKIKVILDGLEGDLEDYGYGRAVYGYNLGMQEAVEMVQLMNYQLYGQRYIDDMARGLVRDHFEKLAEKHKMKGNGHG